MSAFIIGKVTIKDLEKFKKYAEKAGPTIAEYNGEFIIKGQAQKALTGNAPDHKTAFVIRFKDMETLDSWYNSDEYQSVISLRDEGAHVEIITYEQA